MISNIIRNFNRKEDKVKPYLEFKSSTPMTITPNYTNTGVTLQYSLDTVNWVNIVAKAVTPSSNVIYFRGSAMGTKSLFSSLNSNNAWIFTGATNLEAIGNINMLIQDVLGGSIEDIPLAGNCYSYMFYGCTKLNTVPILPATKLATSCYSFMFYGCTSLTTPPALPVTTLTVSCYRGMFYGCFSLVTAPELPATTLANNCYQSMFNGCSSLVTAPALPATTLARDCYSYMFRNCTSLVTVPALPATTLADSCYQDMFFNCSKIKISTTKVGSYVNEYRVPIVGTGTFGSNSLSNMFGNTGGTFKGAPTINTTYYTENQVI